MHVAPRLFADEPLVIPRKWHCATRDVDASYTVVRAMNGYPHYSVAQKCPYVAGVRSSQVVNKAGWFD